jgi:hypothetical protein
VKNSAEHLPVPPRMVRLRRQYRFLRVVLLLALLSAPTAIVLSERSTAQELQQLADDGVVVTGRVEDRDSSRSGKSRRYRVTYSFPVGDRRQTGRRSVSHATFDRLSPGASVTITYLPADPQVSRIGRVTADAAHDAAVRGYGGGGALFAVLGAVLYAFTRAWRRSVDLLASGRLVTGRVIAYESFRSRKKKDRLRYAFRSTVGPEHEGVDRLTTKLAPPPEPGSEIAVLQLPENPDVFATVTKVLQVAELVRD